MARRHTELRETTSVGSDHAILLNPDSVDQSDDLILIDSTSGDQRAVFYATVREKPLDPKTWVKVHPNVAELFGGTLPDNVVVSGEDAARRQFKTCKKMQVEAPADSLGLVKQYFRSPQLVHPMEELRESSGSTIRFRVSDAHPHSPGATYRVHPEKTTIEFVEIDEDYSGDDQESSQSEDDGDGNKPYTTRLDDTKLDDVVGLTEVKEYATSLLNLYQNGTYNHLTEKYSEDLVSKEGSLLLYGPPGCGKTMIAKGMGNMFFDNLDRDVVFMRVTGSDVLSKYQGQSEEKVREIFEEAIDKAGSNHFVFIFIDEVESLVTDRNQSGIQESRASITNEFLAQMNTIEENIMIIGATNLPFKIDSAASRRFHTKLFCPHPGADEMARKWRSSLEGVELKSDEIDFDELGELSEGYTPAEIDNRILGSHVQTEIVGDYLDGDPRIIDQDYLEEKLEQTNKRTIPEYIEKIDSQLRGNQMSGYTELKEYIREHRDLAQT